MIGREIVAYAVAGCLCLGGFEAFSSDAKYERALNDPDFYHLVDEAGNPVSELTD